MRSASDPEILERTQGLINYIRYLAKSDQKPARDLRGYDSVAWLASLRGASAGRPAGAVLTLEYPPHRPQPPLPAALRGHIDEGALGDPDRPAPRLAQGTQDTGGPGAANEAARAYGEWLPEYQEWQQRECDAIPARELYTRLREMAATAAQSDDRHELVLASGLLESADPPSGRLSRHLLTRRVSIDMEPDARLVITLDGNSPSRVEDREFLTGKDGYSADRAAAAREELDDEDLDPLGDDAWAALQRWTGLAFTRPVRCDPAWATAMGGSSGLSLTRAPAVILRQRAGDALERYYERIAAALAKPGAQAPLGLAQLVAVLDREERLAWAGSAPRPDSAATCGQLLPLAANEAQRRVLERMASDTAVVVQGPPGTGKTHTIANLLCALLAQGHRVLVTSQREQALRELRDKLPPEIAGLCVTATSARRDGTDDFSRSINALSDLLGSTTQAREEKAIQDHARRRDLLLQDAERLRVAILASREAEWAQHPEAAPGYSGTLADVAARITTLELRHGWLSRLGEGVPVPARIPPLSAEEALELRGLLAAETDARRSRRGQRFPGLEVVPDAGTFRQVAWAARHAGDMEAQASGPVRALTRAGDQLLMAAEGRVREAAAAARALKLPVATAAWPGSRWESRALRDMLAGRDRELWRDPAAAAAEAAQALRLAETPGQPPVTVPDLTPGELEDMLRAAAALRRYLLAGGRLRHPLMASREQRAAQGVLGSCLADGHPPESAGDLDAVITWLRALIAARVHAARWAAAGFQLPEGDTVPVLLGKLAALYRRVQALATIAAARDAVRDMLDSQGIRLPALGTPEGWDATCGSIAEALTLAEALRDRAAPGRLAARLPPPGFADPPELAALRDAAHAGDPDGYERSRAALEDALAAWRDQERCDALLERLRAWHPPLADELADTAQDPAWEERLACLPESCAWAAARAFCEAAHDPGHDRELQLRLDNAEAGIAAETTRLAAAWARLHLLRRITAGQRQALESYRAAVTAVGKGRGRYAPGRARAARSAMRVALGAVPAWVMTAGKVAEHVPPDPGAFDVVIIDESSQSRLEALFLLWLAPRVIAVGDDRQCAPGWRGQDQQRYRDHLTACLPGLPAHERLGLEPASNLYQLLLQRFPDPVRLVEHFRSMPEIIGWSSRQFYNDSLLPYRQFRPDRLPPLQVIHVDDGDTDGRDQYIRNEPEAKHLVEKLQELLADPAYSSPPRSFAIIALQGDAQASRIDKMISASVEPALIARHRIRTGTPPGFQGAEADVVLLSMVAAGRPRAKTDLGEQRRFNVAATRARDQMWLFTSVTRDRLAPEDLRHSLLSYMEDPPSWLGDSPSAGEVSPDALQHPFESLFQQRLFRALRQDGYHVVPRFPVSSDHAVDLLVSGAAGRVAVTCDGPVDRADIARVRHGMDAERDLRRAGWHFARVRESQFTLDPGRAMNALRTELSAHGIHPGTAITPAGTTSSTWAPAPLSDQEEDPADDQDGARP